MNFSIKEGGMLLTNFLLMVQSLLFLGAGAGAGETKNLSWSRTVRLRNTGFDIKYRRLWLVLKAFIFFCSQRRPAAVNWDRTVKNPGPQPEIRSFAAQDSLRTTCSMWLWKVFPSLDSRFRYPVSWANLSKIIIAEKNLGEIGACSLVCSMVAFSHFYVRSYEGFQI